MTPSTAAPRRPTTWPSATVFSAISSLASPQQRKRWASSGFRPQGPSIAGDTTPSTTGAPTIWTPPTDAHPSIGLLEFLQQAWPLLEPSERFVHGWHLERLCEHLEAISRGRLHDLLINVPPGTTKSLTVCVFWPAWEWTWQPWTRWLTNSYDAHLSVRDAVRTRRLMQSEWYQHHWGAAFSFTSDQNVKGFFQNDKTGWRIATSPAGGNTGDHAHRVVVDDPHPVNKAESELEREGVLRWWRETMPSRRLPGGARVVVGQRVHEEDLTHDWLEREGPKIHHLNLQMEYEQDALPASQLEACHLSGALHDPRTVYGELLAPERFPASEIERLKIDLGPYAYSGQYQQTPTPRAGMVLNPAWFKDRPPDFDRAACDVIMAFDLNYSEKDSSDWTIGITAAVERLPEPAPIHLLDVFAAHLAEERHDTALAEYISIWHPILVGIEKRAYEKQGATRDLVRNITRLVHESAQRVTIEPVEADADKVSRAQIIPGRAKAGLISVDRSAAWWLPLSTEMSRFPRSTHDDRVDTLAYVVRLAAERLSKVRTERILFTTTGVPIRHRGSLVGGRRYDVDDLNPLHA